MSLNSKWIGRTATHPSEINKSIQNRISQYTSSYIHVYVHIKKEQIMEGVPPLFHCKEKSSNYKCTAKNNFNNCMLTQIKLFKTHSYLTEQVSGYIS